MKEVAVNWTEKVNNFAKYESFKSNLIYGDLNKNKDVQITIAIPTYNRPNTLRNAIDSALRQKGNYNYEIIIVDNYDEINVENDTLLHEITQQHENVLYYRNEKNIGMMGNWNRCYTLARGKWVVLLHDDDMLYESYLEIVYPWLEKTNCTLAGVFHSDLYEDEFQGNVDIQYATKVGKNQKILNLLRRGKPFKVNHTDIFANIYPAPIACVQRRDAVIDLGGFEDFDTAGAVDEKFFVNQMYNGKVIIIPEVLSYRGIGNNDSLNPEMPKQGIFSKYSYGKYAITQLKKWKRIRQLNLDVSMRYMALSIESRFNKDVDLRDFLIEIGVSKKIVGMPLAIIKIMKYVPLLALIFRTTGEIDNN